MTRIRWVRPPSGCERPLSAPLRLLLLLLPHRQLCHDVQHYQLLFNHLHRRTDAITHDIAALRVESNYCLRPPHALPPICFS